MSKHRESPAPVPAILRLLLSPIAFALVLTPSRAWGSPVLETIGATETPTPYSARVLATGSEAAYFNPALLTRVNPSASTALTWVVQDLSVGVAPRPPGIDVTSEVFDAREVMPDGTTRRLSWRPLPTNELRMRRNGAEHGGSLVLMTVGGVVHAIPRRLAFSVHAVLPVDRFQSQRPFYPDEREQYFSNSPGFDLLGDRLQAPTIVMASAWRPLHWLHLGGGVTFANTATSANQAFVPDTARQEQLYDNVGVEVKTKLVPHFGVAVEASPRLVFSGTFHLPYRNETGGMNELQLWNYAYTNGQTAIRQPLTSHSGVLPWRAALGASYEGKLPGQGSWRLGASAMFARWSSYTDRHGESPLDRWFDTLSGTLGGVLDLGVHRVGLDWMVAPSPVPDQVGRTNYVDNTRVGFAGGWSMAFTVAALRMRAGLQAQVQRLIPRSVTKSPDARNPVIDEFPDSVDNRSSLPIPASWGLQTNNPGYPGFWSSGWIGTLGASLAVTL